MFSTDGGKTWRDHRVITDEKGYNYTAIREVRPGRLLYVHDAPHIRAVYVDVERLRPFDDSRLQQGLLFDQEGRRKRPGSKDYAELH
jgi:hypothetical protein